MPASFNQPVIDEFRANNGKVGGPFEGSDLLLLTTTGARTGERHTSPLGRLPDGDRILVVASAGGAPRHPAWYHNLLADPHVTVETGAETYEAVAVPLNGAERDRAFARVLEIAPGYGDYQRMTTRTIPVVALHRADPGSGATRARAIGDELRELHDGFRQELAALRASAGAPPDPARRLREHCLSFCEALARHHGGEEYVVFPHLRERFPELEEVLDRLRSEHVVVDRLRGELQAVVDGGGRPEDVRAEIERLAAELEAHFAHEEERLVPLLNSLATAPWPSPSQLP
ncbi:nitroreductase/quinone reductase family protein [Nonomuraea sp. NPDC048916]|uniref:nitroreductase/quinone reductase family protein n=1 Tax=Nonomuraea sp. NPDC048916 TaxID=3154232 RepID=UPI0033EDE46B